MAFKNCIVLIVLVSTICGAAALADDAKENEGVPGMTGDYTPPAETGSTPIGSETKIEQSIVQCINPHEAAEMHAPKPEAPAVLRLVKALAETYSKGDLERMSSYFADDVAFFDEEANKTLTGKEAVLKRLQADFKKDTGGGKTIILYTIDSPYIKVLGNTAVVTYRAVKSVQGSKLQKHQAFVTEMFVKDGERWKLAHLRGKWSTQAN